MFLGRQQWSFFRGPSVYRKLYVKALPYKESKKYDEISRKMVVPFRIF